MIHPQFDPIAFSIGPISVHWYGLAYLVGFAFFWALGRLRAKESWRGFDSEAVEDLLFYGMLGVILGARIGFCLFYQPRWYLTHPVDILKVWQGGMSAHGGMIGAIIAIAYFSRMTHRTFLDVADFVVPMVPLGIFLGRLGNFVNGELWGRVASEAVPWAMVFPQSGSALARHPSQLYEALGEGLFLFLFLWVYSRKPRASGRVAGLFCLGYGLARFVVEFFREPDAYLGFGLFGLSRGQWLTIPVFCVGLFLLLVSRRKDSKT